MVYVNDIRFEGLHGMDGPLEKHTEKVTDLSGAQVAVFFGTLKARTPQEYRNLREMELEVLDVVYYLVIR